MKKASLVILIIATVVDYINCEENVESILCSREGPTCRDCHTLGYCRPSGGGFEYDSAKEFKCPIGWACDQFSLQCVRNGICRFNQTVCPPNNFYIEKLYPDPYSCNSFYGCQRTGQNHYACYEGLAYDPKKKACTLKIKNPKCYDYPVLCLNVGQTGTFGDSKFSYECLEGLGETRTLYPRIVFNRGHRTTTPAATPSPIVCENEGIYPDPEDCTYFYKCINTGSGGYELQHRRCRDESHYDHSVKHCMAGGCS